MSWEPALRLACLLEATARKPGNVHPSADFLDLTYADFVRSAELTAPVLARAAIDGVGRTIAAAVERTRLAVQSNVNLGIALLLAPLAAVPAGQSLRDGIGDVLDELTIEDSVQVYAAIRRAKPAGLGRVPDQDIAEEPTEPLRQVMRRASDRDRVAAQYGNGFADVLDVGVPILKEYWSDAWHWETAVITLHLQFLADAPDSLIARKCGPPIAIAASQHATAVLSAGWPDTPISHNLLYEFDAWLRADGHRRNPGTTADLVAASLFAAFREQALTPPCCPI